jgi:NADPH-dependent 2,4-dienoyl-CoA reductase/sulfur reductase-like enzyme
MDRRSERCDVLVVGAGPAGIAAALAAAEDDSLRVGLLDEGQDVGGQIWRGDRERKATAAEHSWRDRLRRSAVQLHCGSTVFDLERWNDGFAVHVESEEGPSTLHATRLVLANGAREFFLPFPGWTLPNVMGAGALQALAKGGFPVRGRRIVVAGSGPLLLAVAAELRRRGAEILVIAEQASRGAVLQFGLSLWNSPSRLIQAAGLHARLGRVERLHGWWPLRAEGKERLERVVLTDGQRTREFGTDLLACGFGLVANLELADRIGAARTFDGEFVAVDARARTSVSGLFAVGELTGIGGVDKALCEGQVAGFAAAGREAHAAAHARALPRHIAFTERLAQTYARRPELRALAGADTIVCRCEDVPLAAIERYDSWREAKLQSRCGMGSCQGRVCGTALRFLRGWRISSNRPPCSPIPVGSLLAATTRVEDSFEPNRKVSSP